MKHRTGHLFQRTPVLDKTGSQKKDKTGNKVWTGPFYLSWRVNKKLFVKRLEDENGEPITDRRKAEGAQSKFMAALSVGDEVTALKAIAARIQDKEGQLAKLTDEANPPMLITQAWGEYMATPTRPDTGPDTLAVYEGQFGQFEDWMKEKHPTATALRDVTHQIAEDYASSLNHGRLAPGTYNKHLNMLTLVFRVLKRKAKLTENPWEEIPRKNLETQSRRELTVEELTKVCQSATGDMRILFALGIYTGMRLRDCATLRWPEVDMVLGVIRRVPSKTARRKPQKSLKIPLHPSLRAMLAELPRDGESDYILPKTAQEYLEHKKNLICRIQRHFKANGIKVHAPGTGPGTEKRAVVEVGFHSLRHTFVSLCRANDTPLSVVEALVGHSNPAMTRHYTHTSELAACNAVAALPCVAGELPAPAPENIDLGAIVAQIRALVERLPEDKRPAILQALPTV